MTGQEIRILSTRPLEAALIREAADKGILIDTLSFIGTEPVEEEGILNGIREFSRGPLVVVFTSMNAVEVVAGCLGLTTMSSGAVAGSWQVFCIGSATRQLVRKYFGENSIRGTASSAAALADTILGSAGISSGASSAEPKGQGLLIREVTFFCGDQRRDELPEKLRQQGIVVNERVVYKTSRTAHRVTQAYDGIVFFSPSAVSSFFSVNRISADTLLFAIGQTTAETIRAYSSNRTIESGSPEKETLIRQAIDHYTKNKSGI